MGFFTGRRNSSRTNSGRRGRGSSRNPPPFPPNPYWDDKKEEYIQQHNDRAYGKVHSDVKNLNRLKAEILPPPPPPKPMPTLDDIEKLMASTMAKAEQDREKKEQIKAMEKMQSSIAQLEKEKKETKRCSYGRDRDDRGRDGGDAQNTAHMVLKWMDQQRRDKEFDAMLNRKMAEITAGTNAWQGNSNTAFGNINSTYGNYTLQAPPMQGLIISPAQDDDWKRRSDRRTAELEDEIYKLRRELLRGSQRDGCSVFR